MGDDAIVSDESKTQFTHLYNAESYYLAYLASMDSQTRLVGKSVTASFDDHDLRNQEKQINKLDERKSQYENIQTELLTRETCFSSIYQCMNVDIDPTTVDLADRKLTPVVPSDITQALSLKCMWFVFMKLTNIDNLKRDLPGRISFTPDEKSKIAFGVARMLHWALEHIKDFLFPIIQEAEGNKRAVLHLENSFKQIKSKCIDQYAIAEKHSMFKSKVKPFNKEVTRMRLSNR